MDEQQRKLKELMKKSKEAKKSTLKVDSPYARVNARGEIVCTLCEVQCRSEVLFNTHCNSKQHKQALEAQKREGKKQAVASKPQSTALASSSLLALDYGSGSEDEEDDDAVSPPPSVPTGLPAGFFDSKPKPSGLPAGFFDSKPSNSDQMEDSDEEQPVEAQSSRPAGLPADFFSNGSSNRSIQQPAIEDEDEDLRSSKRTKISESSFVSAQPASALPQGFFDNPKKAASAAAKITVALEEKILEEEWLRVKKQLDEEEANELKLQEQAEASIQAARDEREEIAQIECEGRVLVLKRLLLEQRARQELRQEAAEATIATAPSSELSDSESSSEESDEEYDESALMDWRTKKVGK